MMRNIAVILSAVFMLAACGSSPIKDREGQQRYTQHNLWAEGGQHLTTNYGVGVLLPVGSQVVITDTSSDEIRIQTEDGETVTIANVEGYSGQDISGIYDRYFAAQQPDLSRFSSAERAAIRSGEVRKGMSKAAVLVARGYPPAHKTPSTEANRWRFWVNRFRTQVVVFEGGRVSGIRN